MKLINSSENPSREGIWNMFDTISPTYDRVNKMMTFGLDSFWRKKIAKFLPERKEMALLDCATGTADQIFTLLQQNPNIDQVVGIDLAKSMLKIGEKKLRNTPYEKKVMLIEANALDLPFTPFTFDVVTMSFGIRNVTDVMLCLSEIFRVLKSGGRVIILECSTPENRLLKTGYLLYCRHLLPKIGGWISKTPEAYRYLNKTAESFPSGKAFCNLLNKAGFINVASVPLTFGTVSIYLGDKP